ncbi:ATP phosphoribosyltransferase [Spizellomyces punctatus DAOM BR117]|uniref:ATP phosphoribosyltransferase n=1 Tax=Spizellomyces punctatus (strain DAOM BR117) TaxID=645134 RepID=A0A0L0HIB1_SPIPD|nr:ATP phosphoribosyltransferase [Spizellomyces punctatus DAOM BR117]KND00867.1 ATP phosphoribosyltransferase [Spizellomyces punctatus DAOM BR117]|eukprot:XP_016608906.1 ATP phosphoribosyltransferase [Spizellomyces punctatus DAOM BR117]
MDFSDLNDRLLFAIPKKGRLHEHCLTLLKGADIQFHRRNRLDIALSTNHPIALVFLPAADIGTFVGEGNVDIGITGQDMVVESRANVEELLQLGFGKCNLCVQVPISSPVKSARDLVGKRIVTSFESVVRRYFDALESGLDEQAAAALLKGGAKLADGERSKATSKTTINYINGSVEAACALGLADGIVDLVESGETMREAKLHAITTLLTSQAVLICNPKKRSTNPLIETLMRRIQGVIAAQKFVLCNYNISRERLREAVRITPGKKAPTISPLENSDWVAVSSMVLKDQVADIMDRLEAIGATDILVFQIHNCRVVS